MEFLLIATSVIVASLSAAFGGVFYEIVRVLVDTSRRQNLFKTLHQKGIGQTFSELLH